MFVPKYGDNGYSLVGAVVREDDKTYDDFGSLLTGEDYLLFRTLPMQFTGQWIVTQPGCCNAARLQITSWLRI